MTQDFAVVFEKNKIKIAFLGIDYSAIYQFVKHYFSGFKPLFSN